MAGGPREHHRDPSASPKRGARSREDTDAAPVTIERWLRSRRMRRAAAMICCLCLLGAGASAASAASARDCRYTDARADAWVFGITVVKTKAISCASGARILRSVGSRLEIRDYRHLGLSPPKRIAGYDCSAHLTGDSAWEITCHRNRRSVTGFTAN